MSISSALNNALSGLNASSRSAELISNNVANALTPGYSRQTLDLSSSVLNGRGVGVKVSAVRIAEDPVTTASRRLADANVGSGETMTRSLDRIASALGNPGDPNALASKAVAFEVALQASANDPSSSSAQSNVVSTAQAFTSTMNQISTENRRIRMDADASIQREVGVVNSALQQIGSLNSEIQMRSASGGDVAALMDQRKKLIDQISSIIPIKTARRDNDTLAIYSAGGQTLLDGIPAELGFNQSGLITPDMTIGNGALSGLTINGQNMEIGTGSGLLDGGSLSAHFEIRDYTVPGFDAQLDAYAVDVVERFQSPSVDPTLGTGDAGLFTDGGLAFTAGNEQGLAGRLSVNALVNPREGGEIWRVRDGLNAASPGFISSSDIVGNLLNAASATRTPSAGLGVVTPMNMAGFAAEITSQRATNAVQSESFTATANIARDGLMASESASTGVRTDEEMQRLLLVEQAFAANARVVSVADNLIQKLLEM